jgi:hypothetical protein
VACNQDHELVEAALSHDWMWYDMCSPKGNYVVPSSASRSLSYIHGSRGVICPEMPAHPALRDSRHLGVCLELLDRMTAMPGPFGGSSRWSTSSVTSSSSSATGFERQSVNGLRQRNAQPTRIPRFADEKYRPFKSEIEFQYVVELKLVDEIAQTMREKFDLHANFADWMKLFHHWNLLSARLRVGHNAPIISPTLKQDFCLQGF